MLQGSSYNKVMLFRGHDESSTSLNKGTFREMIDWYKDKVEVVKDAYYKGSKNCQMLSPFIQKDLTKACAEEVTSVIMDEIRGSRFSVLIDESQDVSIKEQMAMVLRLVWPWLRFCIGSVHCIII